MQGDLTTNKYPTHGIRTPNPWGGKLRYFFGEFLYRIITDLTTRPRNFRHYIHVFTQGRGIKPQFVLVVFCGSPSRRKHCQVHYVMSHRLMSGYVWAPIPSTTRPVFCLYQSICLGSHVYTQKMGIKSWCSSIIKKSCFKHK